MNKTFKFVSILLVSFVLLTPGVILNLPPVNFLQKKEFSEKTMLFTSVVDIYSSLVHSLIFGILPSLILYFDGYFSNFNESMYLSYVLTALAFIFTPGLILNLPPLDFVKKGKKSFKENKILFTNKSDVLSSIVHGILVILIILYLNTNKVVNVKL